MSTDSIRSLLAGVVLALIGIAATGCALVDAFTTETQDGGFTEVQTDSDGDARVEWANAPIEIHVQNEDGQPITGASIEAFPSQDELLLFIDKEEYLPKLKRLNRSEVNSQQLRTGQSGVHGAAIGVTLFWGSYLVATGVASFFIMNPQAIEYAMTIADVIKLWPQIVKNTKRFAVTSIDKLSQALSTIQDKAVILIEGVRDKTHGSFMRIKNDLLFRKETIKEGAQKLLDQLESGKDAVIEYTSYKYRQVKEKLGQGIFDGGSDPVQVPIVKIRVVTEP